MSPARPDSSFPKPLLFVLVLAAAGAAGGFIALGASKMKDTCTYGSGVRGGCKSRPAPTAAQLDAVFDGSALAAALGAFRATPDGALQIVGVGLNRWGETSIALPTGATAFGEPRKRYRRFDAAGRAVEVLTGAGYEDVSGPAPFDLALARPEVLRATLARAGGRERFAGARLEAGPMGTTMGLAWTLSFATRGSGDAQSALFRMAADGGGLCHFLLAPGALPAGGLPACAFGNPPATRLGPEPDPDAPPPPLPEATTEAVQSQLDQLACVQAAKGDVKKLQRCVAP